MLEDFDSFVTRQRTKEESMNISIMDYIYIYIYTGKTCDKEEESMNFSIMDFLRNKWIFCSLCWKTMTP